MRSIRDKESASLYTLKCGERLTQQHQIESGFVIGHAESNYKKKARKKGPR